MFSTADEFVCYASRDWSVSPFKEAQRRENIYLSMRKIFSGIVWIRIHIRDMEKKVPEVKHAFEYPALDVELHGFKAA